MKRLAILGASGHGKVAADIALQIGWEEVLFFDDNFEGKDRLESWSVVGNTQDLIDDALAFSGIFVAIGNNQIRHEKLSLLSAVSTPLVTLIHPKAVVSPFAIIAQGSMVVGGAVINAFCHVRSGGIINTGATVGHDCYLYECVHVAPGANVAGDVKIGRNSWVGIGAAIHQGVMIGSGVTIGAGAAVIADVPNMQTVVGVPARATRR